jgi:hypothetical protein
MALHGIYGDKNELVTTDFNASELGQQGVLAQDSEDVLSVWVSLKFGFGPIRHRPAVECEGIEIEAWAVVWAEAHLQQGDAVGVTPLGMTGSG